MQQHLPNSTDILFALVVIFARNRVQGAHIFAHRLRMLQPQEAWYGFRLQIVQGVPFDAAAEELAHLVNSRNKFDPTRSSDLPPQKSTGKHSAAF